MGIGTALDKCHGVVGRMAGSGPDVTNDNKK